MRLLRTVQSWIWVEGRTVTEDLEDGLYCTPSTRSANSQLDNFSIYRTECRQRWPCQCQEGQHITNKPVAVCTALEMYFQRQHFPHAFKISTRLPITVVGTVQGGILHNNVCLYISKPSLSEASHDDESAGTKRISGAESASSSASSSPDGPSSCM